MRSVVCLALSSLLACSSQVYGQCENNWELLEHYSACKPWPGFTGLSISVRATRTRSPEATTMTLHYDGQRYIVPDELKGL
ncbi:hypothetical protein ACQKQA_08795 [Pseudomonas sp. NPDC089530]|uniref:hypothetical protein n=1 Tax=Pseudomonas sp. NPDC089530 TaxID=3390651 RepID=UPI003CFEFE39